MDPPALRPLSTNVSNEHNANDLLSPLPLDLNRDWARSRQSSVSSVSSSSSTESSSTASLFGPGVCRLPIKNGLRELRRHYPNFHPCRHRIVLTDRYENADVVLFMPKQHSPDDENLKTFFTVAKKNGFRHDQTYVLYGPVAKRFCNPALRRQFPHAIYPYIIVPRYPSNAAPRDPARALATPQCNAQMDTQ